MSNEKQTPEQIVNELRLQLMDLGPMWHAVAESFKGAVFLLMQQGFDKDQACYIVAHAIGWRKPPGWREDNAE